MIGKGGSRLDAEPAELLNDTSPFVLISAGGTSGDDLGRDSGRAGMGGGRSPRRAGRCGEPTFLLGSDPGSILLKVYEEKRLLARRSRASDRCSAAKVARVSGVTSGMGMGFGGGGSERSILGRLKVGRVGAGWSGTAEDDARGGVSRVRIGEPLVISESTEKRDTGRGSPKLSRLALSGRGGIRLGPAAGAKLIRGGGSSLS